MNVDCNALDEAFNTKLGTKEHWIEHYKVELKNYEEYKDSGEIWFGRAAEKRLVNYVAEKQKLPTETSKLIDFGCGNGSLLRALRQKGYAHLYGVDYSEEAILLAEMLSEKCMDSGSVKIVFKVLDLLDENFDLGQFDVVFDKGTWDALSLSADRKCRLRKYKANVCKTLRQLGLFIMCSCNYTRNELEEQFSNEELQFFDELPSENVIEFGGQKGSTTTCIIFQKL